MKWLLQAQPASWHVGKKQCVNALRVELVEHLRTCQSGVQGQKCCSQGAASIAALRLTQQVLLEVIGCILGSLPPPVAIKDPCTSCLTSRMQSAQCLRGPT